jgi:ferredoxin
VTYVVNDDCIRCKYMDCVDVCPVDCFYQGETRLVIDPGECVDCGKCAPECPVEAIRPGTEPGLAQWLGYNAEHARLWPNVRRREIPKDLLLSLIAARARSGGRRG